MSRKVTERLDHAALAIEFSPEQRFWGFLHYPAKRFNPGSSDWRGKGIYG